MADQAAEYREKLIETLAEADDDIMHMYLGARSPARSRSRPASAGRPSPAS